MLSFHHQCCRWCRCHTFHFCTITFVSLEVCRSSYHSKIQVKFNIGNHSPNFGWIMALFWLSFYCSLPLNNFWWDALISFKVCRSLYHCKIQVKFNIGSHRPNFGWVMALFVTPALARRCDIGVLWPVRLSICPFVNNWLVSATPPTVFCQSFWNFTDVLAIACRCAYCLLIILRFFFFNFFRFVN